MIKTILFDVDGVILSEERYFDASALTVWELLHNKLYLGLPGDAFEPAPAEQTIRRVRNTVFAADDTLNFIKSRGINSNWDMVFLTFSYQLIRISKQIQSAGEITVKQEVERLLQNEIGLGELKRLGELARTYASDVSLQYQNFAPDFSKGSAQKSELLLYLNQLAKEHCGIETNMFSRNSQLWNLCQEAFQEWYLGDDRVAASIGRESLQKGKKGFLADEIPIVEPVKLREILLKLQAAGYTLGIGTGRPTIETHVPLAELGLLDLFEPKRVVTATHVLEAEAEFPQAAPLAKPHPYCYVKGLLDLDTPNRDVLAYQLPIEKGDELLIVGDSLADFLAAQAIGCRFAATLTGLSGQAARSKFEEVQADYILNDVSEILSVLL